VISLVSGIVSDCSRPCPLDYKGLKKWNGFMTNWIAYTHSAECRLYAKMTWMRWKQRVQMKMACVPDTCMFTCTRMCTCMCTCTTTCPHHALWLNIAQLFIVLFIYTERWTVLYRVFLALELYWIFRRKENMKSRRDNWNLVKKWSSSGPSWSRNIQLSSCSSTRCVNRYVLKADG
jgi:hypothetical protein